MKAETCEDKDLSKLRFPCALSLKLDGIRCVINGNKPLSNTLKPIRNAHINNCLSNISGLNGFDGELLLTNLENHNVPGVHPFNDVSSAVMNGSGTPMFTLWVFDSWADPNQFKERYEKLHYNFQGNNYNTYIKLLPQTICNNLKELAAFEEKALEDGYEGIMIRELTGKYKFGRSTLKGQELLKRKTIPIPEH